MSPPSVARGWWFVALTMAVLLCMISSNVLAYSSFFTTRCATCHTDDSPTCNGCHEHRGNLWASADHDEYAPGDPVSITLHGGERTGWVRGLLFDDTNVELDRATGPTGTGDDGLGNAVVFPIVLQGFAPLTEGDYVWEAAWFGGNVQGTGHLEQRTPVTIHVMGTVAMHDEETPSTWGKIKTVFQY